MIYSRHRLRSEPKGLAQIKEPFAVIRARGKVFEGIAAKSPTDHNGKGGRSKGAERFP
jgi:hypothetical protein